MAAALIQGAKMKQARDWGRDIFDLCNLVDDLESAPGLIVESQLPEIGRAGMKLCQIFNETAQRMFRRDN